MIVIDSSIAISWGMPDEKSVAANRALALARQEDVLVPAIFWTEVRNICLVNERRGRIAITDTTTAIKMIEGFRPQIDDRASHEAVLNLAREHGLSGYDAAYLALAIAEECTLATLDKRLARSAIVEGLSVISEIV